jgi:hypothetical protein
VEAADSVAPDELKVGVDGVGKRPQWAGLVQGAVGPVPVEVVGFQRSAWPVSCSDEPGSALGMMISRVPPPALPDLRPAVQLACPARPLVSLQECRVAGAAARGRRAAPHPSPAPAGLGRPGGAGRAGPASATEAEGAPADHARHRPAGAPPLGSPEVDLSAPDGPAAGQRRDHRAHRAPGYRERFVGLTSGSRASCSSSATGSAHPRSAGSSRI